MVSGGLVRARLQVRRSLRVLVLVGERLGGRGGRRLTAAGGGVGVQHLQEEVVDQHHVLPLHGGQVVHALVAVDGRRTSVNTEFNSTHEHYRLCAFVF